MDSIEVERKNSVCEQDIQHMLYVNINTVKS